MKKNVFVSTLTTDTGGAALNQFVIHDGDVIIFQSYNSIIASYDRKYKTLVFGSLKNLDTGKKLIDFAGGKISATTAKYLLQFLRIFVPFFNSRNLHGIKDLRKIVPNTINNYIPYDGINIAICE